MFEKSKTSIVVKMPTGKAPKVSVVIISLNEEKNIITTLKSLKNQSCDDFEVILADGNSTDSTIKIAEPFVDGIVIEKNQNCSFERNAGAHLTRGEIIAFSDSDNILPKDWVEKIINEFQNPEIIGVWGPIYFSDTGILERIFSRLVMRTFCFFASLSGSIAPASSNYAFRRKVFFSSGGFDTKYTTCEDYELIERLKKTGKVVYSPSIEIQSSARRVKKMGYFGYLKFQLGNLHKFRSTGVSTDNYEEVR